MVIERILTANLSLQLLAESEPAKSVLEQLSGPKRAAVVMALLGITLIGMFLVVFVMVGGHWVRRMARHRPGEEQRRRNEAVRKNAEFRETLHAILPDAEANAKTDDTIQLGTSSKDTTIDK